MSFSINTNVASLQAQNYLRINSVFQNNTINEVTSGLRIVNSGDDAAGLAVANGLRSDEAVLTQGIQNANNGLATLQTVDGGMSNISQLLDRARTLATESASGTFTGTRSQLQSEFSSVLTEINRQATNIGMNQGGEFNTNLSVFIGGGMDGTGTHSTTDATALANGSVSVNLSGAAVDTQSLGLQSYSTAAATATLGTITGGLSGGVMDLKFYGPGDATNTYAAGLTVAVQNLGTAGSLSDVVNDINTAIAQVGNQAGAANAAFKAQGIQAVLNSAGTGISFTSANGAFSVSGDATGTNASKNILGTAAAADQVYSSGLQQVQLGWQGSLGAGDTQNLTISAANSNGTITTANVNLPNSETEANAVTLINQQLSAAGGPLAGLVAVADGTNAQIDILGTGNNAAFQVSIGACTTSTNGVGGTPSDGTASAQGTTVKSTGGGGSSLDISTVSGAQTAVSALATAVTTLGTAQAAVGKGENNFNYAINLANSQLTNEATAESSIRDANMAAEAANLTKAQILMQAGVAALAQANSAPQMILSLLSQH